VTVDARPAGDGTVSVVLTLDRQAAAQFSSLAAALKVDDLRRAGWMVVGPTAAPDGTVTVRASRRFANPAGAQALLVQVSGAAGPLRGLHLIRRRTFGSTRTELAGTVDLRSGVEGFGDPKLATELGLPSLSAGLAALHQQGAADPALRVEVAARLPGKLSHANAARVTGGTAVWTPALGSQLAVDAVASERNSVNLVLAAIAVLAMLGLIVVVVRRRFSFGISGIRLGRRRRHDTWRISDRR